MTILRNLRRLFFPHRCCCCGAPLVGSEHDVCTRCMETLPLTHYATLPDNLAALRLRGRVDCEAVTASVFFREGNTTQTMLHNIKYRGEIGLAHTMGRFMGEELAASHRFDGVELLVPVPLHRRKQRRRGYNQSLELCRGIAESFPRPISVDNLVRTVYTESQTHKNRIDRMANMEGVFAVRQPELFAGRHLLLVDDVMTTGATVEAACQPLLAIDGVRVSIATLAVAGDY